MAGHIVERDISFLSDEVKHDIVFDFMPISRDTKL